MEFGIYSLFITVNTKISIELICIKDHNDSLWMYRGDSNADTIQRSLKSRNKVQAVPSHGFLRPPNQQNHQVPN